MKLVDAPKGKRQPAFGKLLPPHQARNHQPPPGCLRHPRHWLRTIWPLTSKIKQPPMLLRQLGSLGSQYRLRLRHHGTSLSERLIQQGCLLHGMHL